MNDPTDRHEDELARRARKAFQDSVRNLDGSTRSRLAQARARAVDAAGRRRIWWPLPSPLVPLGGIAAACLVAVLFWQMPAFRVAPIEPQVLTDLDILLDGEELELFEELEFYAWLLEQPELLEADETGDDSG